MRELPRPPEIEGDPDATEMIRVWIAHEEQFVSLLLGMWADADDCEIDEREAWGELLADAVRHVANGLNQSQGWDRDASIESITASFVRHVKEADPEIEGEYVEDGETNGEA